MVAFFSLVFSLFWLILHVLFATHLIFQRIFHWMSFFSRPSSKIFNQKIPKHVAIILTSPVDQVASMHDLSDIARWWLSRGTTTITFFDPHGGLINEAEIFCEYLSNSSSQKTEIQYIVLLDGAPIQEFLSSIDSEDNRSSETAVKDFNNPRVIHLASKAMGRVGMVRAARRLCNHPSAGCSVDQAISETDMLQAIFPALNLCNPSLSRSKTNQSTLPNGQTSDCRKWAGEAAREPELGLVIGPAGLTSDLLPWQMRLTELLHAGADPRSAARRGRLEELLDQFAGCQQRLGT